MNTHSHMLPCPFCGGRAEFNEHDEKCYFTVLAKAKAAPKGDVSGIAELIPAWNRRIGIDLTRTQWQPIATAPTDGTVVLATLDGSDIPYVIRHTIDLEARQASAFRPGKESAKPVRASLGATDQSAAVAQEHQPCELFPIARA